MTSAPRTRADLTVVELDGEAVIFDERAQTLHHLNPTATLVFTLLDGTASVDELAADIAEGAALPIDDVRTQMNDLVHTFTEAGLLEGTDG